MGNAVCPQVASALGRCLALAALHETPSGAMLLNAPDPDYDEVGWDGWRSFACVRPVVCAAVAA